MLFDTSIHIYAVGKVVSIVMTLFIRWSSICCYVAYHHHLNSSNYKLYHGLNICLSISTKQNQKLRSNKINSWKLSFGHHPLLIPDNLENLECGQSGKQG